MAVPNVDECSKQELLDAEAHVWTHIYHYINSMALKCAIQLGIPDTIHKHGKPMTLPRLAIALSINEPKHDALHRLMRILVHSKFFNQDEEEAYCLTLASRLLLRDEPSSVAPYALAVLDPGFMDTFHHLGEWFGNECVSPFDFKHGKTLWEYAGIHPRWNQLFNEAMCNDSRLVASVVLKECRHIFEGLETVVDVGGGAGILAKAVADGFPGLKATVLDLPHVVAELEGSENLEYVSGDMFDSVPPADAVLLKWILHDWSDEECVKILEKCKEAIAGSKNKNGGKLIVIDMILDDTNGSEDESIIESQLLFDVSMMTCVTGKERTKKEWVELFSAVGFKTYKFHPVLRLRSVIEVFP
ncbi:flavonoid 8-O-methyltransferase 1-like [Salvia miltiorrhiza]|uniref:flavonoid 8-O-methyltransferase 1-like n=1 Tax=Salvia miltiorrhiza TaxID=226208 RepID=UPI0025ACB9A7|nr:flavonoid 8-O-methyltransferase 1-like [Salvia miltiorrhiza]